MRNPLGDKGHARFHQQLALTKQLDGRARSLPIGSNAPRGIGRSIDPWSGRVAPNQLSAAPVPLVPPGVGQRRRSRSVSLPSPRRMTGTSFRSFRGSPGLNRAACKTTASAAARGCKGQVIYNPHWRLYCCAGPTR